MDGLWTYQLDHQTCLQFVGIRTFLAAFDCSKPLYHFADVSKRCAIMNVLKTGCFFYVLPGTSNILADRSFKYNCWHQHMLHVCAQLCSFSWIYLGFEIWSKWICIILFKNSFWYHSRLCTSRYILIVQVSSPIPWRYFKLKQWMTVSLYSTLTLSCWNVRHTGVLLGFSHIRHSVHIYSTTLSAISRYRNSNFFVTCFPPSV